MANAQQEHDELTLRLFRARRRGDLDYLVACLKDPRLQHGAAKFLGELGNARAIEPLLPFLDARDPSLRVIVIQALTSLGASGIVPRLLEIARDDEESFVVRSWAIDAIGKLADTPDAQALSSLLRDPNWRVRRLTAKALAGLGSADSEAPLREAMAHEHWFRRRPYKAALRVLGRPQGS